jgi:uncharacterized membrane protein
VRALVPRFAGFVDRGVERVGALGPGAFAWPALIGMGLGTTILSLREPRFAQGILKRRATVEFMRPAIVSVAVCTVVTILVAVGIGLFSRARRRGSFGERYATTLRRGAFIAGLPFVLALQQPIEMTRDWLTIGFALIPAVLAAYSAAAFVEDDARPRARPVSHLVAPAIVAISTVAWAVLTARLGIQHHLGFGTGFHDVGEALDLVAETSRGRILHCSLCGGASPNHFEPILALLAPIFALSRNAETLIVIQTMALALGAPTTFLLARRVTGSPGASALLGLAYLAHPGVQGVALSGVHGVAFALPLFLLLLYFLEIGAVRGYAVTVVLLLFTREDTVLAVAGVGLFALFGGSRERARLGLATLGVAVAYCLLLLGLHRPAPWSVLAGSLHAEAARPPAHGRPRAHVFLDFHDGPYWPIFVAFSIPKMDYVARLFAPLLGLPLLARGRVLFAYGAALALLSEHPDFASLYGESGALILPFVFVLAAYALGRIGGVELAPIGSPRLARVLPIGMVVASVLSSASTGAFTDNRAFRAGSGPLVRAPAAVALRESAFIERIQKTLPKDAKVAAPARIATHLGHVGTRLRLENRGRADYIIQRMRQRTAAKVVADEESKGYLARMDRDGDLLLFRTRYRGFVPSDKQVDDE